MAFELETSMYGKFAKDMEKVGLGVDVEGDCLAPECQPELSRRNSVCDILKQLIA
jgi:hypothetical protein